MMFHYKAKAPNGKVTEGELKADTLQQAAIEVRWLVDPHATILALEPVKR